jgi:hypothetical protein
MLSIATSLALIERERPPGNRTPRRSPARIGCFQFQAMAAFQSVSAWCSPHALSSPIRKRLKAQWRALRSRDLLPYLRDSWEEQRAEWIAPLRQEQLSTRSNPKEQGDRLRRSRICEGIAIFWRQTLRVFNQLKVERALLKEWWRLTEMALAH